MPDLETRIVRRWQRLQEARDAVRPLVGELSMGLDSVNDIYADALERMGVAEDEVDQLREEGTAKIVFVGIRSMKDG